MYDKVIEIAVCKEYLKDETFVVEARRFGDEGAGLPIN